MKAIFKKVLDLFKDKSVKIDMSSNNDLNEELVARLRALVGTEMLLTIESNPVASILVVNTYSKSFFDLGTLMTRAEPNRKIVAINLYSYFKDKKVGVNDLMDRLAKYCSTNPITLQAKHDIEELLNNLEQLL